MCTEYEILNMKASDITVLLRRRVYSLDEDVKASSVTSVLTWFKKCIAQKKERTKELYESTLKHIVNYYGEQKLSVMRFEQMKLDWLLGFENHMTENDIAPNTQAIHMRNLRHVCNFAIDNEVTTYYPFRRYKIKYEKTRKRNIKIDKLRDLMNHEFSDACLQRYLDCFKLMFMLIGINIKDLCLLKGMRDDYIEYRRAKTNRPYSIKVEPEALSIIDKYRGKEFLLNYMDNCKNYRSFYGNLVKNLNKIRDELGLSSLTSYYARHSWATIASSLDIPKETISAALGHAERSVTDVYIEFDMEKVDRANRKVIDWVLYGKRE